MAPPLNRVRVKIWLSATFIKDPFKIKHSTAYHLIDPLYHKSSTSTPQNPHTPPSESTRQTPNLEKWPHVPSF